MAHSEARSSGRPPIPQEQLMLLGSIRLTQVQWDRLALLGGVEWLRRTLDAAGHG
jgi:hypothetical protein